MSGHSLATKSSRNAEAQDLVAGECPDIRVNALGPRLLGLASWADSTLIEIDTF